MIPSPEEVEAARTPSGGWKKEQLAAWGVPWPPPKGWKQRLEKQWRAARQAEPEPRSPMPASAPRGADDAPPEAARHPEPELEPAREAGPPRLRWSALEKRVLGAMLLSKEHRADAVARLRESDFHCQPHRVIFWVLARLLVSTDVVDVVVLEAELARSGESADAGGTEYLLQLTQAHEGDFEFEADVLRLHKAGTLHALRQAGRRITAMTGEEHIEERDLDAVLNAVEGELDAAVSRREECSAPLVGEVMEEALDVLEGLYERRLARGVPTGFEDLDLLTHGLQRGELTIISGRPATGKSTLALDLARACSLRHGLAAVFFTLDASTREVTMRLLAAECNVPLHFMRAGTLRDEDWNRLARRMADINEAPLYLEDAPYLTLIEIRSICRRLKRQANVQLVVIDYVQLLDYGTRQFASRYEEISEISRHLKFMAKDLDVAVVAVSQLNRGPEQRTDKRPMVQDLRDSGSLEDDADLIILLHREAAYERNSPHAGQADLIIGKHRHGPTATITVGAQLYYNRFVEPSDLVRVPDQPEPAAAED